jgi:phage gpG-like protein
MGAEANVMRTATARLMRAGFKLQSAIKLALSRQGRANFGRAGRTTGPLGANTVRNLTVRRGTLSRRLEEGNKLGRGTITTPFAKGKTFGLQGRFSAKGNLLGLVMRSRPGEPPRMQSGRLRNSISVQRLNQWTVRVGTNIKYARWLEFGTRGGKVITPKRAKALFDPVSGRFFGKRVVQGAIKPRPFFRPTVRKMRAEITATLAGTA